MCSLMKSSGIAWIGDIPENWKTIAFKRLFEIISGSTPDSTKAEYWDGDIVWITPAAYKTRDHYVSEGLRNLTQKGYNSCSTTLVPAGSLIFSKRAPIGTVAIAGAELCTSQGCLSCIPNGKGDSRFYYHVLSIYEDVLNGITSSTTFKEISLTDFGSFRVALPPLEEQRAIAEHLDHICATIDNAIALKNDQLNQLVEYKKSLISECVCRGVPSSTTQDVVFKDSGIEWIGEMPAHWTSKRMFNLFAERKNKNARGIEQNLLSLSYGKIKRKNIQTNEGLLPANFNSYNIIEENDIVFRMTDLQNDKRSLRSALSPEHGIITTAYIVMRPITDDDVRYFAYLMRMYDQCKVFYGMGDGVRQGVNYDELSHMLIICPPKEEQAVIADFLDSKSKYFDQLAIKIRHEISELEQYKKSTIWEYVTGKRRVHIS